MTDRSRSELRAAVWVLAACVVLSLVGAVVWGLLTPAEHLVVVAADRGAPLTNESEHQFDAVALFVGIASIVGLISAMAAWQWRSRRGPILYLGLLVGSGVGAAVMSLAGEAVARLHYPHPDAPKVDQIVALAPSAVTMPALIAQAFVASSVTLVLALLSARDDLGVDTDNGAVDDADVAATPAESVS